MKNVKKILAVGMIIVLAGLYIWAFVAAFFADEESAKVFNAAIFCTILFPIVLYIYMWTAKWLRGRGADKKPGDGEGNQPENVQKKE